MEMTMLTNIENGAGQAMAWALAAAVQNAHAASLVAAAEDLEAGLATSMNDQDNSFLYRPFIRSTYTRPPTK
jgi:hypothetical protein